MAAPFGNAPPLATRRNLEYARTKVDVANTAFWEGKEFRISREYAVGGTPLVFRFESPVPFILQKQALSCDTGNIRFRAYRDTQGSQGGTFGVVQPIYRQSRLPESQNLSPQVSITTGGTDTAEGVFDLKWEERY